MNTGSQTKGTTVAGLLFEYYIGGTKPLSGPEAPFHYTEHH